MRRHTTKNALFLVVMTALATAVAAQQPSGAGLPDPRNPALDPGERLPALLERVRLERETMKTLTADFTQLKESSLLLAPAKATGSFYYAAPDRIRWEYRTPDPITVLIRGDEMTTWYHDLKRAEEVEVGRYSQRILQYLGASSSLDQLLEYFQVELHIPDDATAPYELDLEPRYARIAKRLNSMSVWIEPRHFLPVRLRYVEADGDLTEYRFDDLHVNAALTADRFTLQMPREVQIQHLELGGPAGGH